jgi:V/A-type H+-transporting ATPase subunit E
MDKGKAAKLRQKIISDAEVQAQQIVGEGEAQAQSIMDAARAEAARIMAQAKARAQSDATEHVRRQVSLRELEAKKAILAEKGRVIEEVFSEVLENLRRNDREGGYSLTKGLLLKAIESGDEEIIVAPEDRKAIPSGLIESVNSELKKAGKRGEVVLSAETRAIKGGLILRRGRTETNASFETLLTMLRDDVETEIANILFGETKAKR